MTAQTLPALAFIGGGNMSRAMIGGLLLHPAGAPAMTAADPNAAQRSSLGSQFPGVRVVADNVQAATEAPVWVLAVKPQQMKAVARSLASTASRVTPLVVSVAAGIRASDLGRWLGPGARIVRAMPNRPALVGAGVTALYAHRGTDAASRGTAEAVLSAVGRVVWVGSEDDIDTVTAVSGSGPAYFLLLTELLEEAAVGHGLSPEVARVLAVETAAGTARLAQISGRPCAELRAEVTSAGGTTAAALDVLAAADLRAIVGAAVAAAKRRAGELAAEFGAD